MEVGKDSISFPLIWLESSLNIKMEEKVGMCSIPTCIGQAVLLLYVLASLFR